jgi:hypothetical protein
MHLTLSEEQLQKQIHYFAYYQLAGGMLITCLIILSLAGVQSLSGLTFLMHAGFLGLGGFATYCGYLCLKQPGKGLRISRVSLAIQFLGFAIGAISFRFFAVPFLAISIDLTDAIIFKIDFSLAEFSFKLNSSSDRILLSVNVVAMLLFFRTTLWLNEWRTRYHNE